MPRLGDSVPPLDRAMSRTTVTDGCWECDLGLDTNGYPNVRETPLPGKRYGRLRKVSILMYEAHNGPVPEGLVVRHTCHNVRCIRPEHLIVGTHKDNSDDKVRAGRQHRPSRSHLERTGHEFVRNGYGKCAECQKERSTRWLQRNKDVANARARERYAMNPEKYREKNRRQYEARKNRDGIEG